MELDLSSGLRFILFVLLSIFYFSISYKALHNTRAHGFYRFFAFEAITILILLNLPVWTDNPTSLTQLFSWFLLFFSIIFVIQGFSLLHKLGGKKRRKDQPENLEFEDTINLVTTGLYSYIRHPMYSSILLLAWGAYFKEFSVYTTIAIIVTTISMIATARYEETETLLFFGSDYKEYMQRSKMFIPYIF